MSVLITGGAGYLGSVLAERLLDMGHRVTVLDNFRHGVASLAPLAHHSGLTILRGDARDGVLLSSILKDYDAIIPLAAIVGAPACAANMNEAGSTNFSAVAQLVDLMNPSQRIIFPNTNSGYGTTPGGEECTEATPLKPISYYGSTKTDAERAVLAHPNSVVLRLATLFGASHRMRIDLLVNEFVYRAVRDKSIVLFQPEFRRNFLHVRDAADVFRFFLEECSVSQQVFNVGDSRANMTKLQLCERIAKLQPFHWSIAAHAKDPDQRDYLVSNEKIEALGWHPRRSLDGGIRELITCFQQPFESHRNA